MGNFGREVNFENLIYAVKEGYHLYRRSSEYGGLLAIIQMRKHGIEVKSCVVAHSPLLPKTCKVRINVEYVSLH